MASRARLTAKSAAKQAPAKVVVLRPSTPAERDYLRRGDVPVDVATASAFIHRAADELERRGGATAVTAVANMRRCARRLTLLARSLKREVVRG